MSDDLIFDTSVPYSLGDLIREEYHNYFNWNGRVILQFFMHACLFLPKWLFNILNSFCFVGLMLLIYLNIDSRKKYDFVLFTFINLLVWQFGVCFDQTILWLSGSCNYLWGMVIILGYITLYRYELAHIDQQNHPFATSLLLFFFGFIAGWCNENTSGGGLLLILIFTLHYYLKNKKIKIWMITGMIGMALGLMMMVLAPANAIRGALMHENEEHSGILAILSRFLNINAVITHYFWFFIIIITILLIYFKLKRIKNISLFSSYAFLLAAIATSYVLIVTPKTMDRAHFGSGIFIIIVTVQLLNYIPHDDFYFSTLKYSFIMLLSIHMFFSYCENGADLIRIQREVNEREEYILEQKAQGKTELTLPMLRPEFQTKYSFMYSNDITENPDEWGNKLYRIYYKLDKVTSIPRSEWTEY